jgi:hypothetical protein
MTRWKHPLLIDAEQFDALWSRPADGPILFVAGAGYDPRAAVVLKRLQNVTDRRVDALLIALSEDSTDEDVRPLALTNRATIAQLITAGGGELHEQPLPQHEDPGALGRLISKAFQLSGLLDAYKEVVIEISAMPRSVFFPLIRGILLRAHAGLDSPELWEGDLHVAVCENPAADASVLGEGTRAMAPIGGFAAPGAAPAPRTTIWVPVLGEGGLARVKRLYEELGPDEVCPVLPWPSQEPRRGDRIVLEYRQFLFDEVELEPRNVIYAAERNPFDLYRTLGRLHDRYRQALKRLDPVTMVLSSHSSKLLSVGVLLAAYDHELEVQHVGGGSYGLRSSPAELAGQGEIFDLWLTGEPYR